MRYWYGMTGKDRYKEAERDEDMVKCCACDEKVQRQYLLATLNGGCCSGECCDKVMGNTPRLEPLP